MIDFLVIILILLIILICIIALYKNKFEYENYQNRIVTTWTPYVMDCYNQPCYSNYFYGNGYMYPIY